MSTKTMDEILADAKASTGESATNLPSLREIGDHVAFEVVQVLRELRYKDLVNYQINLIIQVTSGTSGGEPIDPGRYKLYCGSAALGRIAETYGFLRGDRVALVLQRTIPTGKGSPMKDFSYSGYDVQGQNIKNNLGLRQRRISEMNAPVSYTHLTLPTN